MRRSTGKGRRIVLDERQSPQASRNVRRATVEDVRAIWEIFQAAPEAAEWSEGSIRDSLLDKLVIALVSVSGEEISGCIFGVDISGEAEILNLAVKPASRRKGVARELVRQLLSELEQQKTRRVFLEVRESNAGAIRLYQGLGFRPVGRRKAYYAVPEEDALVLERVGT
jgi:ribosomal-protein-alanine N-acetyltransferase